MVRSLWLQVPLSSATYELIVMQPAWRLGSGCSDPPAAAPPALNLLLFFRCNTGGSRGQAAPPWLAVQPGSREEVKLPGSVNAGVVMQAALNA